MKMCLYQINLDKDKNGVAFESLEKVTKQNAISPKIYERVFDGDIECNDLEETYRIFNMEFPDGYRGRSMSVSDIVKVIESDTVEPGFYYCDSIGFKKVDFDDSKATISKKNTMTVVICEPDKVARVEEIGTELIDLQNAVNGSIEIFYPFAEEVCIVCNDEGKLNGMPLNRAVYDGEGRMIDIIAGTFFICDCSTPNLRSLSTDQQAKYIEKFLLPETFVKVDGKIQAIPYDLNINEN